MNTQEVPESKKIYMNQFNVETQFERFIEKSGFDKRRMPPYQTKKMKAAFYSAFGQFVALVADERAAWLTDSDMQKILENISEQVCNYFVEETDGEIRKLFQRPLLALYDKCPQEVNTSELSQPSDKANDQ